MGAGHSWSLSFAFANPKGCYVFVNLPLYKEIFSLDRSARPKFCLRIVRRFFFNGRDRGGGGGVEPARARERETNRDVGGHDRRPLGLATQSDDVTSGIGRSNYRAFVILFYQTTHIYCNNILNRFR